MTTESEICVHGENAAVRPPASAASVLRRAVSKEAPARSKLGSRIAARFAGVDLTCA